MGMFDWIKGDFYCPYCGKKNGGFQTKCLDSLLHTITDWNHDWTQKYNRAIEIHSICENKKCKKWISLIVYVPCDCCMKTKSDHIACDCTIKEAEKH